MTKAVCTCTDQKNKASVLNRNAKLQFTLKMVIIKTNLKNL